MRHTSQVLECCIAQSLSLLFSESVVSCFVCKNPTACCHRGHRSPSPLRLHFISARSCQVGLCDSVMDRFIRGGAPQQRVIPDLNLAQARSTVIKPRVILHCYREWCHWLILHLPIAKCYRHHHQVNLFSDRPELLHPKLSQRSTSSIAVNSSLRACLVSNRG